MKLRAMMIALGVLTLVAAGAGGGYYYAATKAEMADFDRQAAAAIPPGKKVLYWHDPMYPQSKFDKPGKSPFMDMQLVPVLGDAGDDGTSVRIDAQQTQNLGARLSAVRRVRIVSEASAVGNVAFDEGAVQIVQARVSGWIERVLVRSPNDAVLAGQALAEVYSPEWLAAQEELLALRRAGQAELVLAARTRLGLLGFPEVQIRQLEQSGTVQPRVTLRATTSGIALPLMPTATDSMVSGVASAFAREGMQVTPGMTLFRIASLSQVWIVAEVPEVQAALVRVGQAVEVEAAGFPNTVFKGAVATILPDVNPTTRSIKARISVVNPNSALRPGMFVRVKLETGTARAVLTIPTEAVIATGTRKIVMVAGRAGRFAAREVVTGTESRVNGLDVTEIKSGLIEGEQVVASGQFLIDSEASLKTPALNGGAAEVVRPVDLGPPMSSAGTQK